MKKLIYLILVLGLLLSYYSCDKIEDTPKRDNTETNDSLSLADDENDKDKPKPKPSVNTLTPEQHKDNLNQVAINLLTATKGLATSQAVEAAVNLVLLMEPESGIYYEGDNWKKSAPLNTIRQLNDYENNKITELEILTGLKNLKGTNTTDIELEYQDVAGTYTWNPGINDFDFIEGSKFIVKFPATINSNANNAIFTVDEFMWIENPDPIDLDLSEVPVAVSANLKIDGIVVLDLAFSGTYDNNGIPLDSKATLNIGDYNFYFQFSSTDNSEAKIEQGLLFNNEKLILISAGIKGDYSDNNINDNIITYYDTSRWCVEYDYQTWDCIREEMEVYDWQEVNIENIIQSTYGAIEILNIKIIGEVNIQKFVTEMENIYSDDYWNDDNFDRKAITQKEVDIMNEYMKFYAAYDNNQKIAEIEFYVIEDEYMGYDCYYNDYGDYVCQDVPETYYRIDGRLVFSDGSKVALETYFEAGFDKFMDEFNDFLMELENEYSGYGAEIGPVNY